MSALRNLLYLVFGLLLGAVFTFAHAETKPAVTGYHYGMPQDASTNYLTACQAQAQRWYVSTGSTPGYSMEATITAPDLCRVRRIQQSELPNWWAYSVVYNGIAPTAVATCPVGQNWTLQGSNCVRPDCVAPQVLDPADGVCKAPPNPCSAKAGDRIEGWAEKGSGYSGSKCIGGCSYDQSYLIDLSNPQDERVAKDGKIWGMVAQVGTGQACSAGSGGTVPEDSQPKPKDNPKKPPCAAGEGVIGTTTGKVLCLPEGTPEVRKPVVGVEKKAEIFADGSKKETATTTTRDPVTNNKDVSVNVTVTAGPTGGTQAGPVGTSSSTGQSSGSGANGNGEGGGGDCDPSLQFCGGPSFEGIYQKKEKTFSSVLNTFQTELNAAPVVTGANAFFTATVPSGSCPNWVVNVPILNITLDISQHFCTSAAVSMMQLIGTIVLAGVSFIAFRWAIL